jgi:hypothetical protein
VEAETDSASALARVLDLVDEPPLDQPMRLDQPRASTEQSPSPLPRSLGQMYVGFVSTRSSGTAMVRVLGATSDRTAQLAEHLEVGLVDAAIADRSLVLLVETSEQLLMVGLVQTKLPQDTVIRGQNIVVEADEQLTLRSGRAAIQLRSDGSLEMLGTRIAATSRGVFRLIGRALRLN